MNKTKIAQAVQIAFVCSALGMMNAHANPLALSETPLTVSSTVNPNVMLIVDNSGSMNHIIWHKDYRPTTTYGTWQFCSSQRSSGCSSWSNLGNDYVVFSSYSGTPYTSLERGSCTTSQRAFRKSSGSSVICLTLPNPAANERTEGTRYEENYLRFLLDNYTSTAFNTAVANGTVPNQHRMQVARDVAKNVVETNTDIRFGLTIFNVNDGGIIRQNCQDMTNMSSFLKSIDDIPVNSNTPLAETLYEVTRYFRGLTGYHHNKTSNYASPIQFRCQKNFAIVITDGLPTQDATFPSNDPDDPDKKLPNWDGLAPPTTAAQAPNFPKYSDGFGGSLSVEGSTLYLDDIAKFAYDIDMKKTGNDNANKSYNDKDFEKQNLRTYTIGFTVANQMLEDAAEYGAGQYFTADNAEELNIALKSAMQDIRSKLGSSSSAATSGGSIQTDSMIYQARMNSADWTGQLLAYAINSTPGSLDYGKVKKDGPATDGAKWDAGSMINSSNWNSRQIISNKTTGIAFRWTSFTTSERTSFFNSSQDLLEYIRGRNVSSFRTRNSLLGDIVNSAPQYVAAPSALYPSSLESVGYSSFRDTNKNRPPMVYVGSNNGMLHAFDAKTGQEQLAYIPGSLLGRLKHLSEVNYKDNHKFYVDGTPTIADAFIGGQWRTMLVGGLNRGGQSIYALDVTNPAQFTEGSASSIFRWEFTDKNDSDLGFTYSRPAIVKLQTGDWAAIFGNGYNNTFADGNASTTGNAALFIVNLSTGSVIKKISTGSGTAQDPTNAGRPNGLATVTPVDVDGDHKVDYVYAGDLFGNMWKFDLSSSNESTWSAAYKLFEACAGNSCTSANRQAITTRPSVIRHPLGEGQIVLFGTGKYLEPSDNNVASGVTQSFYAVWDDNKNAGKPVARGKLQQQSIVSEQTVNFTQPNGTTKTETLRVTSNNAVNWANQLGWYMNLQSPSGFQGERQITDSLVRNGQLIFTTMIPSTNASDPCAPSGRSWIMELNAVTGSRLEYSPFDLNGDRKFSTSDYLTINIDGKPTQVPSSGRQMEGGNAQTPAVAVDPKNQGEIKYVSTSEGLEQIVENLGRTSHGRQSWRELFPY